MGQISGTEHIFASRQIYLYLVEDGKYCSRRYCTLPYVEIHSSPEAVNISNMAALIDAEGKPHFKYIVEGANLFLTQQARLHLEKRKVILFKDSSANKGVPLEAVRLPILMSSFQVA